MYNDINNTGGNFYGAGIPPGTGSITTTNHNGDPCDQYYNIFLNPQFQNPTYGDFRLLANSPCIDAGDPHNPPDPDASIADMGALYHVPEPNIYVSPNPLLFGTVQIGQQEELLLTIYNLGDTTLVLYDIYTSEPSFSANFNPADSLILAGDSLTITVLFSPQGPDVYIETMSIENNDELTEVSLLGIGEGGSAIGNKQPPGIPKKYALWEPYPNPFNPTTTLSFALPHAGHVRLLVYDVQGTLVSTLVDDWRNPGVHEALFDASGLASGIYLYHMRSGEFDASGKMVLVK